MSYRNRNNVHDREACESYINSKEFEWDAEEYAEEIFANPKRETEVFDLMVDEMAEYLPIAIFDGTSSRSSNEILSSIRENVLKRLMELDEVAEVLEERWWEYDGE